MGAQVQQNNLPSFPKESETQQKEEELVQTTVKHTELSLRDETVCLKDSLPETEVAKKKLSAQEPTPGRKEKKDAEVSTNKDTGPSMKHTTSVSEDSKPIKLEIKLAQKTPVTKELRPGIKERKVEEVLENEDKIAKTEPSVKQGTSVSEESIPVEKENEVAEKKLAKSAKEQTPEKEENKVTQIPTKEDTLGMIEQRRKATQARIQAHLNGLDKTKVQPETKEETTNTCDAKQERGKECTVDKTERAVKHEIFDSEDPLPAEKEAEVAEKNLLNLTKEP